MSADDKIKVLIIDGQNNHRIWPKTTVLMKKYLEESGRFAVDVARTKYTWRGGNLLQQFSISDAKANQELPRPKVDPDFEPAFFDYDVVLSNFGAGAADWPKETQDALTAFVATGGGLVIVHAANNSFPLWQNFNRMIGLGGWGGRDEKSGPYVYVDQNAKTVRDDTPGAGGSHGPEHHFQIVTRVLDHPITKGLPRVWMHTKDELYQKLRGPAENMTILATAFSAKEFEGTERHEPILMTINYGQGRIYHTPMGHADYSMACVGFITTLIRGAEWAATGNVTLTDIPRDFPSADEPSMRSIE